MTTADRIEKEMEGQIIGDRDQLRVRITIADLRNIIAEHRYMTAKLDRITARLHAPIPFPKRPKVRMEVVD